MWRAQVSAHVRTHVATHRAAWHGYPAVYFSYSYKEYGACRLGTAGAGDHSVGAVAVVRLERALGGVGNRFTCSCLKQTAVFFACAGFYWSRFFSRVKNDWLRLCRVGECIAGKSSFPFGLCTHRTNEIRVRLSTLFQGRRIRDL